MQGRVRWVGGRTFLGESESGHGVVIDSPASAGGRDIGASPMELVLLGAGGCSAFDVVEILEKGREQVTACELVLDAERASGTPRVFTSINLHFIVTGRGLKKSAVERAVRLSAEKYCSATAMLGRTAVITQSSEVIESEEQTN